MEKRKKLEEKLKRARIQLNQYLISPEPTTDAGIDAYDSEMDRLEQKIEEIEVELEKVNYPP